MPESLIIKQNSSKEEKYAQLMPQIKELVKGENNLYANLANISAALKEVFNFWWVGFYLVDKHNPQELVLGPFQVLSDINFFQVLKNDKYNKFNFERKGSNSML